MPAEEIEFYEVLGDMLVSLGRSYNEIKGKGKVTLKIDGHEVSVDPLKPKYDPNDKNIFGQLTTVYDAAQQLYGKRLSVGTLLDSVDDQQVKDLFSRFGTVTRSEVARDPETGQSKGFACVEMSTEEEAQKAIVRLHRREYGGGRLAVKKEVETPIPILCHQEHMKPIGVCRACLVEVTTTTADGRKKTELAPACYLPVANNIEVNTLITSDRVAKSVRTVVELLLSDYQHEQAAGTESGANELQRVANHERIQARNNRFPRTAPERGQDDSSPIIYVDRNACILCDRCVRACNDIRENHVIGRMGKGFETRIAFDADAQMGESSCVACGECMITCPTDALTNRSVVKVSIGADGALQDDAEWKGFQSAREEKKEEINIRNTSIQGASTSKPEDAVPLANRARLDDIRTSDVRMSNWNLRPGPVPGRELRELHPDLFSDMSERFLDWNLGAVVRRHFKDGEVICREGDFGSTAFIIERGTLEVRIRTPFQQPIRQSGLFGRFFGRGSASGGESRGSVSPQYINIDAPVALQYGNPVAQLTPRDRIFGEMTCMSQYPRSATVIAKGDCTLLEVLRNVVYMLQRTRTSRDILRNIYRENALKTHLRQVELFTSLFDSEETFKTFYDLVKPKVDLVRAYPKMQIIREGQPADSFYMIRTGFVKISRNNQVLNYLGPGGYFGEIGLLSDLDELRGDTPPGICTATCAALDHVDVARIKGEDFKALVKGYPDLKQKLLEMAKKRLIENDRLIAISTAVNGSASAELESFIDQGLYNAQSLLILDLEKCTRCDECAKACADVHGGVTRLVREGLRFDKYLVASSCRSCFDPVCMVGCPVGSIRRTGTSEIKIEDWCIGCGKCADNCPYGNINIQEQRADGRSGREATTCDLCRSLADGQPSCVYACPHDAAHRMTGPQLWEMVNRP
ncbi:MAG: cyclic nucleotide-binding domain-containing protein [Pirellulales bacterium]